MVRKKKPSTKTKAEQHTHLMPKGVFKSDKYGWCPEGFFALKFTDVVGRVCIQQYANLIARRDPQLSKDLTEAVEKAGGWEDHELEAALVPEEE